MQLRWNNNATKKTTPHELAKRINYFYYELNNLIIWGMVLIFKIDFFFFKQKIFFF